MEKKKLKTSIIKQSKKMASVAVGTAIAYGIGAAIPSAEPETMAMIGASLSVANAYGRDAFEKIGAAAALFGTAYGIQNGSVEYGILGGIAAGTGMAIFEKLKRFEMKRLKHRESAKAIKEMDDEKEKHV